jgi:hypothetical protein
MISKFNDKKSPNYNLCIFKSDDNNFIIEINNFFDPTITQAFNLSEKDFDTFLKECTSIASHIKSGDTNG